jgi:C_GCAxxG_C_C family probable redox protein
MSEKSEKAVAMFGDGYNCAQSVLGCCCEALGVPRETAVRIAGGFGGGMGGMGGTCGAVTGAYMALGLKFARTDPKDAAAKQKVYALVREFAAEFKRRYPSLLCLDLVGYDLSTPEGIQKARESGVLKTVCPPLVRSAAEIVEEMLARPQTQTQPQGRGEKK